MAKQEKSQAELYREERKKRLAKAAKKNSKKSISSQSAALAGKVITIIIVAAIVIALGGVVFNQTGILERSKTAFTVADDTSVSQAEYSYYYISMYNTYSQYAQYGYISLDTSSPISEQAYDGSLGEIKDLPEDKTATWADFFSYSAKQQISFAKAAKAECEAADLTLSDSYKAAIDHNIEEFTESAKKNNYSLSAFLKANYGKGMNEKLYRQILEEQQYVQLLNDTKTDEFKGDVTKKEIDKEYKDNITNYARVSLAYFAVPYSKTTDEEGSESVDASSKKACENAMKKFEGANNLKEFKSIAGEISKSLSEAKGVEVSEVNDYRVSGNGKEPGVQDIVSDEKYSSWVADAKTQADEVMVVNSEDTTYAFIMVNPLHKASTVDTYDSRHILIKYTAETEEEAEETADRNDADVADSEDVAETTEAKKEETKEVDIPALDTSKAENVVVDNKVTADNAADKEAYKKVQQVLQEYLDGDHTAEAFGALAHEYSEDTGSNENGGLYEGTKANGSFVPPYESWCTQDGRKEGDVGIVEYDGEAEGGSYSGYHLIYFVKSGTYTWKSDVIDTLASEKYSEYADKLSDGDTAKISAENVKVETKVVNFLDDILVRNARNSANQQQQSYDY